MKDQEDNEKEIEETLDFEKPDYSFTPNGVHKWRQTGPYLVCKSCEIQHATYIGMEKIMVGVDQKGNPVLKKRFEIYGK